MYSKKLTPSFFAVASSVAKVSHACVPSSEWVPKLIFRRRTYFLAASSAELLCSGISGCSSTISTDAFLALVLAIRSSSASYVPGHGRKEFIELAEQANTVFFGRMPPVDEQLAVEAPIARQEVIQKLAMMRDVRNQLLVVAALVDPAQGQLICDQLELRCVVTDEQFHDQESVWAW